MNQRSLPCFALWFMPLFHRPLSSGLAIDLLNDSARMEEEGSWVQVFFLHIGHSLRCSRWCFSCFSTNIFSYSNHNIDLVYMILVTKNSLDNPWHYKCFYQASLHRLLRIKGFILVLIGRGAARLHHQLKVMGTYWWYHQLHHCFHMEGTFPRYHFMLPSPSLQRRRRKRGGDKWRRERGRLALSGCETKMAVKTFCLLSLVLVVVSVAEY